MKRLSAVAAFLLASTAAQAQYSFEYGGRTIRIDPDRGTVSIPGVYDNSGPRTKRSHSDRDSDRPRKQQAPEQAKTDPPAPAASPAPAENVAAPADTSQEPSAATAGVAPADTITSAQPPIGGRALQRDSTPATKSEPAPVAATAPPSASQPATPGIQSANTPVGVWLTEEKEGKVRIEQCGANLCGYSVDAKSNQNGERILINMKPGNSKWSGRIHDPKSGSTYDSTIALKGSDTLRVQGCAFGGMFCGSQTWSRVN